MRSSTSRIRPEQITGMPWRRWQNFHSCRSWTPCWSGGRPGRTRPVTVRRFSNPRLGDKKAVAEFQAFVDRIF